jgi:hypothetical protein
MEKISNNNHSIIGFNSVVQKNVLISGIFKTNQLLNQRFRQANLDYLV